MFTIAGHAATFKVFTKIFNEYEMVEEVKEVRE